MDFPKTQTDIKRWIRENNIVMVHMRKKNTKNYDGIFNIRNRTFNSVEEEVNYRLRHGYSTYSSFR